MAVISKNVSTATATTSSSTSAADPLLPFLWSIEKALNPSTSIQSSTVTDLDELVSDCIKTFKNDPRYQNDVRFLKIWFLYMDGRSDYESVFTEMEQNKIRVTNSLLYESYALFMEAKGMLIDAFLVYQLGISRNAEPIGGLKKAQVLFLERVSPFRTE